jgi:hypothetical protein
VSVAPKQTAAHEWFKLFKPHALVDPCRYGNAQPGLLGTLIWALLQFGLPQLLHHYMHKAVQQPQRIAALAASVSRVTAVAASKTSLEKSDKAGSDEGCSKPQGDSKPVPSLQDEDEICKQEVQLKVQGSSVDDARSTEAAAGPLNAEGSMGQPRPADSAKPSQHAVLEQAASASSRPADLPLARVPSTRVPPSMLQVKIQTPPALSIRSHSRSLKHCCGWAYCMPCRQSWQMGRPPTQRHFRHYRTPGHW